MSQNFFSEDEGAVSAGAGHPNNEGNLENCKKLKLKRVVMFNHIPNREGHVLKIPWNAAFAPLVDFVTQQSSIDQIYVKRHFEEIFCLSFKEDGIVYPLIGYTGKEMVTVMTQ